MNSPQIAVTIVSTIGAVVVALVGYLGARRANKVAQETQTKANQLAEKAARVDEFDNILQNQRALIDEQRLELNDLRERLQDCEERHKVDQERQIKLVEELREVQTDRAALRLIVHHEINKAADEGWEIR